MLEGNGTENDIHLAARIAARYSKGREKAELKVKYGIYGQKLENIIVVEPITDKELEKYMISIK